MLPLYHFPPGLNSYLLSKIPVLGVVFFCLNALLSLAAFFAIAYLATPKLLPFPAN